MTTRVKSPTGGGFGQLAAQKRWGQNCLSVPIYIIMLPQFYQNHLEKQLKQAQYHTLKSLVYINTSDSFGRETRSTVLKKVSGIGTQKTEKKAFFRLSSKNTRT